MTAWPDRPSEALLVAARHRLNHRESPRLDSLSPHARDHVLCLLAVVPGLTLSSGRRSPERNRTVGGAARSFHLVGRAADFVGSEQAIGEGLRVARRQRISARCTGPEESLIHDSGTGRHLHVAW